MKGSTSAVIDHLCTELNPSISTIHQYCNHLWLLADQKNLATEVSQLQRFLIYKLNEVECFRLRLECSDWNLWTVTVLPFLQAPKYIKQQE
jgi:hypothetical protein